MQLSPEQQFYYNQWKLSWEIKGYYEGCMDMRDMNKKLIK